MYRLMGFDTFEGAWYNLEGEYKTEEEVKAVGKLRLEYLEKIQPSQFKAGYKTEFI